MPSHESYLLHIYRSRAASGWQWSARLESLTGGPSVRFSDPEALLAHLQALVQRLPEAETPAVPPAAADGTATSRHVERSDGLDEQTHPEE